MMRSTKLLRAMFLTLLAGPSLLLGGQNAWTGSRPMEAQTDSAFLIAADPANPYSVFAVFQPDLYRSIDGGRTWTKLASFGRIHTLLVHPAKPSTLYAGAAPLDGSFAGLFRSEDSGVTWTKLTLPTRFPVFVQALAGPPDDPGTVYAGSVDGWVYKTTDEGSTWTTGQSLVGPISNLVIDPRETRNVYAGIDSDYYYFTFGAFEKSSDGAATWSDLTPGIFEDVTALAIDPSTPSTLYMSIAAAASPTTLRGLLRSDDSGSHWSPAGAELPIDASIRNLAVHPLTSGVLYAGTTAGVYRSRDRGETWTRFGPTNLGLFVTSLQLDERGRFLHAGSESGAYAMEIATGPIDVAAGALGDSHVLFWDSDRPAVRTLDVSGDWSSKASGDSSTTWTATAIAIGADRSARVLWHCVDGRSGLEIIGPSGRLAVFVFPPMDDAAPVDVAVADSGEARILFTSPLGQIFVASADSSGALKRGPGYGPARGWTAVAITDGPGGTRVLWRCTDGRGGISLHDAGGAMIGSSKWTAGGGFAAEDITSGADGHPRLLRISPSGDAEVSTIDTAGQPSAAQVHSNPGFRARRVSASADGKTRLLWNAVDGSGSVWLLNADNTLNTKYDTSRTP